MLNCIKVIASSFYDVLAVSISRIGIALIIVAIVGWVCIRMAVQVVDGLRNSCFEITDVWKVDFKKKPLAFCFLVTLYSLSFILFLYLGWIAAYDLLAR